MGSPESEGSHLYGSPYCRDGEAISLSDHFREFGLKPDKRLGQHWLKSEKVIRQIIQRADGLSGVLEIGPGPGVLTQGLAEGRSVVALDLDERMVEAASAWAVGADVRLADALSADWKAILGALPGPVGIVSNMPYNITGPLLEKVANVQPIINRAVLMMQREVGEKLIAQSGDRNRGAVSVVFQRLFTISKVCLVAPGCFLPPPKVDSIVLEFRPRLAGDDQVFKFVRGGFSQPRKTLTNNLSGLADKERVGEILVALGLSTSIRPHEMSEENWFDLVARIAE
ncbi:MAG: 16S rRNA (adenine(1518)-N(6)/adenine(1519)-N(6))-dimethyltransferase RsmA [Fimbriimonadaceae bacterium]